MISVHCDSDSPVRSNQTIISIHWGLSLGGVGKYATYIDNVEKYASVTIKSVCILGNTWDANTSCLDQLDADKIFIKSRLDTSWISEVREQIDHHKPDAIMTHGFNGYFVAALQRLLFRKKVPLICSYHGSYHATTFSRKLVSGLYNWFAELFIRRIAASVVCVAEHSKQYLISKGVSSEKIVVIHNGIADLELLYNQRESIRNEWGVIDGELLVGCACRLDPVKGIRYLIAAISKIKDDINDVKLVIVGSGASEVLLKEQARVLGVESRVIFAGFRTDIEQCLGAFDIFALPSLAEYHSIALLEAMRAGKPIIATDVGGNTESVRHMKEAIIVPSKNSDSLVDAIKLLHSDKSLRESLGVRARKRFKEEFTMDRMVKSTADWLVQCTKIEKSRLK